jgi:hypothetical protein
MAAWSIGMPTDSFKPVLDRDLSRVAAREVINIISPLLQEVVNHASWAFRRFQTGSSGEVSVDVAPFLLFHHAIEMIDGVEVLLSNSCVTAAIPTLRSAFEARLGLEYMLEADYRNRSLAWLCVYSHERIGIYELVDPTTQGGIDFGRAWVAEHRDTVPSHPDAPKGITNLQSFLAEPYMVPIEQEYQRLKKGHRAPHWYSLFGGPTTLRKLATRLKRLTEYDALYRSWSGVAHAGDASSIAPASHGDTFRRIRYPAAINLVAVLALEFLFQATKLMSDKFRPEGASISTWFQQEIKPRFDHLLTLRVRVV